MSLEFHQSIGGELAQRRLLAKAFVDQGAKALHVGHRAVAHRGRGFDRLYGGPGDDKLNGGFGHDLIVGGPGNDDIRAVGGGADTIDCGPGYDTVVKDRRDTVHGCEVVNGKHAG